MHRRTFILNSLLTGSALMLSPHLRAQSGLAADWKIQLLRKNLYSFTGRGGTILYYQDKSATVVVDSQFPEQAKQLIAELQKKSEIPFDLLINTHHHGDHSGGNIAFKGLVKEVLAHSQSKINQENQAKARNTEASQYYPTQTFTDNRCIDIGKEKICLHYFGPGHTNGDALVHFENANIVHMGDLLNHKRYPNIDRTAGASMENWMLILDRAYNVFDRKSVFVCGHALDPHMITVKKEYLREMKFFFENLLAHVKKEILAGKTKEEIITQPQVPGMDDWKDPSSFAKVLFETAYIELTAGA